MRSVCPLQRRHPPAEGAREGTGEGSFSSNAPSPPDGGQFLSSSSSSSDLVFLVGKANRGSGGESTVVILNGRTNEVEGSANEDGSVVVIHYEKATSLHIT